MKLKLHAVCHTLITLPSQGVIRGSNNSFVPSWSQNVRTGDQFLHAKSFAALPLKGVPSLYHRHLSCQLPLTAVDTQTRQIHESAPTLLLDQSAQQMSSSVLIDHASPVTGYVMEFATASSLPMKQTATLLVSFAIVCLYSSSFIRKLTAFLKSIRKSPTFLNTVSSLWRCRR